MVGQAFSQVNGYPLNSAYMVTSSVVYGRYGLAFVKFYNTNTWISEGSTATNGPRPFITY